MNYASSAYVCDKSCIFSRKCHHPIYYKKKTFSPKAFNSHIRYNFTKKEEKSAYIILTSTLERGSAVDAHPISGFSQRSRDSNDILHLGNIILYYQQLVFLIWNLQQSLTPSVLDTLRTSGSISEICQHPSLDPSPNLFTLTC